MNEYASETTTQPAWALVTGASSGIGAEFCRQLAAKGYSIVLVARREEKLQAMAKQLQDSFDAKSFVIAADLFDPNAATGIVNKLAEANIEIDYLVNNAGYGLPGSFHVPEWKEHADFIQIMMTVVCELTWRLLPGMRERGRGYIVNIASVAGLITPSAGHTLYGASKSFLVRFSESLALENVDSGVKVSALCPGFTYTEFHDVNGTREMISKMPSFLWLSAERVVKESIEAMEAEKVKPVVVPGFQYKTMIFLDRQIPWLARMINRRLSKKFRVTE